jgi:signal peptide peptidase SppA
VYDLIGATAVIPVEGVIGRKFSSMLYDSGVTSIDVLDRMIRTAADDKEVESILLMFDSPGGLVTGVPETAQTIRNARAQKPVMGYADGLVCSAAYWLASQCDAIYATPSAQVGAIGCYLALLDESRAFEMQGYKVELLRDGKYKGMGVPGTALDEAQRAWLQNSVNEIGNQFRVAVTTGRGTVQVPDHAMQGQTFGVHDALAYGLVDSITTAQEALLDLDALQQIRAGRVK